MRPAALFLCFCAGLHAQPSGIAGAATNALTHEPLSGIHVRLVARSANGNGAAYGAISGQNGSFSISPMPAGTYILIPEARGFLYIPKNNPGVQLVTLRPGEPLSDFKLEMTPRAVILGRVTDENGDPVPNSRIDIEPLSGATSATIMGASGGTTNDRGEFRIGGPPGKYYIKATPMTTAMHMGMAREIRLDGSVESVYATTYYPNGASAAQAAVVEAVAGTEVTGIEIRLTRGRPPMTISGIVTGIPDESADATVNLTSIVDSRSRSSMGTGTGPDGKFTFPGLQPGNYRLYASYSSGKSQLQSRAVEIKLDSSDVGNINLALAPGAELSGTLEIAGEPPGSKLPEPLTVRLFHVDGFSFSGTVEADGTFRITGLAASKYRMEIAPLPENAYVQSIKLDGAALADQELDLSRGVRGSHLKIIVSRKGAEIAGNIVDKDGKRVDNAFGVVLLAENGKEISADLRSQHIARVEPEGHYVLHGVPPGKYHLLAVEAFRFAGQSGDEDLKKIVSKGEEITVKEGDRISRDLKMLTQEDLDAKQ